MRGKPVNYRLLTLGEIKLIKYKFKNALVTCSLEVIVWKNVLED